MGSKKQKPKQVLPFHGGEVKPTESAGYDLFSVPKPAPSRIKKRVFFRHRAIAAATEWLASQERTGCYSTSDDVRSTKQRAVGGKFEGRTSRWSVHEGVA